FVKALTSPPSELTYIRIESSRFFSGNFYIRNIFALTLMPLLSYVWLFYYLKSRSFYDKLLVILTVFMSASILYYDFSKSPLLWYLLSFVFVYFYAFGELNKKLAALLFGVVILALIFAYVV